MMSFRRSRNRHDTWQSVCAENLHLLRALPAWAFASRRTFRTLMTEGSVDPGNGEVVALSELSAQELADIWRFIHYRTEFDMDAMTFAALNQQVAERVPPDLLAPVFPARGL